MAVLTRSVGGKLPVIAFAISAAAVGYDIHEGKPPSTAIVGGVGGAAGSAMAGALVSGPVVWVTAAVVGAGVGVGISAEAAYTNWVPDDVRTKIDDGIRAGAEAGFKSAAEGPGFAWNGLPAGAG